jgi:hypothetical protein
MTASQRVESRERGRVRARTAAIGPRSAFAVRNARRAENLGDGAFLDDLKCECARPDCEATFPAGAEVHRRRPERFIITPDHLAGETVIAAADRFFVVEQQVRPAMWIADRTPLTDE